MSGNSDSPVTVIAKHKVTIGKENEFKGWVDEVNQTCQRFIGYLGTEIIRPVTADGNEYTCIFRFDNIIHLEHWVNSNERKKLLMRAQQFGETEPDYQHYHSLEFWFDNKAKSPSDFKMAIVTFFAIWGLVHFIAPFVSTVLPAPFWVQEMVTVALIVLLMTFLVMPFLIKVFYKWLFS